MFSEACYGDASGLGNQWSNDIILTDQLELHGRISDIIEVLISIKNQFYFRAVMHS